MESPVDGTAPLRRGWSVGLPAMSGHLYRRSPVAPPDDRDGHPIGSALARLDHHDGRYKDYDEDADADSPSRYPVATHRITFATASGIVNRPSGM